MKMRRTPLASKLRHPRKDKVTTCFSSEINKNHTYQCRIPTKQLLKCEFVPQCFNANAPCSVPSRLTIIIFVVHPKKYKVFFVHPLYRGYNFKLSSTVHRGDNLQVIT